MSDVTDVLDAVLWVAMVLWIAFVLHETGYISINWEMLALAALAGTGIAAVATGFGLVYIDYQFSDYHWTQFGTAPFRDWERRSLSRSIDECVNCEREACNGYRYEYGTETVVAGIVADRTVEGVVEECDACEDAGPVEYAFRAADIYPVRPAELPDDREAAYRAYYADRDQSATVQTPYQMWGEESLMEESDV